MDSPFFCEATIYNFIMQGNLGVSERYTVKDGCVFFFYVTECIVCIPGHDPLTFFLFFFLSSFPF